MVDATTVQLITQFGGIGIAAVMLVFFLKQWEKVQERMDEMRKSHAQERATWLEKLDERDARYEKRDTEWRLVIQQLKDEVRDLAHQVGGSNR